MDSGFAALGMVELRFRAQAMRILGFRVYNSGSGFKVFSKS